MAFSFQDIRYGWVALASLGIITGTTIYVANNQRHQVKPEDIIEIALGTYERCLATQTATNPTYSVTPPSFVRTWTSNAYTTNGVTVYTNIVTNTIGWHIDRDMMVSLDTTIKALVPYYVDTNTVYDGTTNIVMLTVTGLWASLGIGDHTNQFTRTPCWTNPISTNWIVNYTSYWPSTNGTATNIVYTSDYQQVVNYAQSWTATGGHVWVAASNWVSEVVIVTNVATYGDYPWQIYVEDLQERYKVLNALKMTQTGVSTEGNTRRSDWQPYWVGEWLAACSNREGYFNTDNADNPSDSSDGICGYSGEQSTYWTASISSSRTKVSPSFIPTNLTAQSALFLIYPTSFVNPYYNPTYYVTNIFTFDDNGYGLVYQTWNAIGSGTNVYFGDMRMPNRCDEPSGPGGPWNSTSRGFAYSFKAILDWQFNYCTNKYW